MGCDFSSQPDDDEDAPTSPLERACGVSSSSRYQPVPKAGRLADPSSPGPRMLDSFRSDAHYDVSRIDELLKEEASALLNLWTHRSDESSQFGRFLRRDSAPSTPLPSTAAGRRHSLPLMPRTPPFSGAAPGTGRWTAARGARGTSPGSTRSAERRASRVSGGRSPSPSPLAAAFSDEVLGTPPPLPARLRRSSQASALSSDLGLLGELVGRWEGTGFSQIFLPHFAGDSPCTGRAYATTETLEFTHDVGPFPDRGSKRADVYMRGVRYLQTVRDAVTGAALHVEPGFWLSSLPATAAAAAHHLSPFTADHAPRLPIVRLGTAPHGVAMVLQGTAYDLDAHRFLRSELGHASIAPTRASDGALVASPPLEHPDAEPLPAGIASRVVLADPNALLRDALREGAARGERLLSAAVLHVQSGAHADGEGISTIPFLRHGAPSAQGRDNPAVVRVTSTYWIERLELPGGSRALQLQYSQTVVLNFGGVNWPHVSVATLRK